MPWLQTFTAAENSCPGPTLAGPLTALTTRSDRLPRPIKPPTRMLLSSRSSCSTHVVSTTAAR
ncbi:hypothetical protein F0U60_31955 [Archangium minus]|uniref:Uncharacterized protein n=1 Tax=Archangium minus TaxID=83450 RepID=A0ABY9XBH5_9BACT|nr:hypothetical protein F0U60_31955 [Archangium minus]